MQTNLKSILDRATRRGFIPFVLVALASVLSCLPVAGQLAITEVMSSASTTGVARDDFWELTNFGTNTVDLASYSFRDTGGFVGSANLAALWAATRTDEPRISPGESILFVKAQAGITTPEDFRVWWGETNLAPDLKIIFYTGFGFSSGGEDVHLWQVTAERTNLVQLVQLLQALPGRAFTYDRLTGTLDKFSVAGEDGAFVAAATDDVGSPGTNTGPVELHLVAVPADIDVDGGTPVTLAVRAWGLPSPQYQWRFNGTPIPGANARTFTLAAATSSDAGQYTVELDNGLERLVTTNATLTVNTQDSCAVLVRPLLDIDVTSNQTAIFHVATRGYPLPTFRWQFNGVDIPGATASTYSVVVVGMGESQTGLYTVYVTNSLCATNASARLSVSPVPNLVITEAMSSPTNRLALGHDTWWELTNAGTNEVNLLGYRWDDNPASLVDPVTVTNDIILPPGQSAIFVSTMTPEAFRRWWGEENLPADLPIISHSGNGLSASGDSIRLWNATAITEDDYVVSASVLDTNLLATIGVSLLLDPEYAQLGIPSIEGEQGAFRAVEGGDIGSPGWTSNEQRARPRLTSIRRDAAGVSVKWRTQPGRTYELRYRNDLSGTDWTLLQSLPATNNSLTVVDDTAAGQPHRFYKVLLLPPSP